MSKLYANFADYVKDTAWFDELELDGWPVVKEFLNNRAGFKTSAESIVEQLHIKPASYIAGYGLTPEEAEALVTAYKAMVNDFHEKTSLHIEAEVISDDYDLDGIEPGLQFLVYGVHNLTLPGMKAIDAGKITSGSWVSGC